MTEVSVENADSGDKVSWLRIIKILLVVIISVVILLTIFLPDPISNERAERVKCMANMKSLSLVLYMYAQDNSNSYPTPEKWCDLVVNKFDDVNDKYFCCPGGKEGIYSYAINPNCEPNSPEDIILLFETKGGWNQVGGPELLTLENHKGKGCNVVFGDLHIEYVKAERIGELKWDIEKQDGESIE
ncbi:MAG: hypothetical protein RQ760_11205 [Sedimentisphaerales bacterium]|nr:hypothetical protein [Sedimentisphaerales bacterium]